MRLFVIALLPLSTIAFSPGQEGEWAKDWTEASRRAREEKKLVLVLIELYRGMAVPERLPFLFDDGALADLRSRRFVGLVWKPGMKAPFQDSAVYGMGPFSFGTAVLVTAPDGTVVGQCSPTSALVLYEYLRSVLRKHPEHGGRRPDAAADPLDRAETHLQRGEFEEAGELLREPSSVRGFRLKALLSTRLRRGDEALAALRRARELGGTDLDVEEGTVLIGMGRTRDAAKAFSAMMDRSPEAQFRLSHLLLRDNIADGKAGFEEVARLHPDTRWGRAAKAVLTLAPLEAVASSRLGWPEPSTLGLVRDLEPGPLAPAEAAAGIEGAIRFLTATQRPDGSWLTPLTIMSDAPAFSVSTTSICALGLIPFRDRKEVRPAVDRALRYVLAAHDSGALDKQAKAYGFGYSVWGRIFALRFLARCSRELPGDAPRIAGAMKGLVAELGRDQGKNGGWTYYANAELAFVTGAALVALADAKDAGAAVPDDLIRRGTASLRKARAVPGKFRYSTGGADPRAEAGPRSPLCELALRRSAEPSDVAAGLDHYLASRLDVRKERGKAICHTGPDGTACYYLIFGYAFAAEAMGDLPEANRGALRTALLEDVLAARLEDGSFQDTPTIGRSYGTGMALLALGRLVRN